MRPTSATATVIATCLSACLLVPGAVAAQDLGDFCFLVSATNNTNFAPYTLCVTATAHGQGISLVGYADDGTYRLPVHGAVAVQNSNLIYVSYTRNVQSVLAAIRLDNMTGSWFDELDNEGSLTPIAQ